MSREAKIRKQVEDGYETFLSMTESMSTEELKKELSILANHREEVNFAKAGDEELKQAKDAVKELAGPYNDAVKALNVKMAFVHILLKERGQ